MSLAVATGTDPEIWWRQDPRTLATAVELLARKDQPEDEDGRQMAG